jgi:hypothetical protein
MGVASFLGGFLLFAATILLLVATSACPMTCCTATALTHLPVSSPVVNNISLLNVNLNGATSSRLTFGVFGYCRLGNVSHGDNDIADGSLINAALLNLVMTLRVSFRLRLGSRTRTMR